ncbi:MAG TPA: 5'/3'-nucleotidase SurE [Fimbriimonadaceae bacterium]|nr:5'/3'-nucleotidase SurE [Fimbriimonadaceae bacterium]
MRILVTNDDGILAPGLAALVGVARQFGEVKVIAPDHERSACGHSMTIVSLDWTDHAHVETLRPHFRHVR